MITAPDSPKIDPLRLEYIKCCAPHRKAAWGVQEGVTSKSVFYT